MVHWYFFSSNDFGARCGDQLARLQHSTHRHCHSVRRRQLAAHAGGGGTRGQQQQWLCVSFEQLQHTVHCAAAPAAAFRAVGVLTDWANGERRSHRAALLLAAAAVPPPCCTMGWSLIAWRESWHIFGTFYPLWLLYISLKHKLHYLILTIWIVLMILHK